MTPNSTLSIEPARLTGGCDWLFETGDVVLSDWLDLVGIGAGMRELLS